MLESVEFQFILLNLAIGNLINMQASTFILKYVNFGLRANFV